MKTLLSGSLAFDTIMVFQDQFKNHILPEQTHILNVSFFTPEMRRYRGGCAGNMAYTLNLLGGEPVLMGTVGEDFASYQSELQTCGIDTSYISVIEGELTAQAMIINDADNNQINAFHPGAMNFAHENKVSDVDGLELAIISPNGRDAMIQHAEQCHQLNIPFFFDPGQAMPLFSKEELVTFMEQATYAVMNDYEAHMLMDKTQKKLQQLTDMVDTLIITKGAQGSVIYQNNEVTEVASAPVSDALDPTGCGDSYRAGLMFGLSKGFSWKDSAQIGALCGAFKIEQPGTQKHSFTPEEFATRYQSAFSESLDIF